MSWQKCTVFAATQKYGILHKGVQKMRAGVTLTGMLMTDSTLFDGLTVPNGIDKDILIDTIVFNYGDLYLTNTDTAWTKAAITVWGKRHAYYLDELYKTLSYNYNPIENYDRYEDYTDSSVNSANTTSSATTTATTAAYDSNTMQPDTASTDSATNAANSAGTLTHTAHIHGNIGVTTAAQMIQGQRDIIKISWYDEAANLFASEFCLMIY